MADVYMDRKLVARNASVHVQFAAESILDPEGERDVPVDQLMDWIREEWPHAVLDEEHLLVWKRVVSVEEYARAMRGDSSPMVKFPTVMHADLIGDLDWNADYFGKFGFPYFIGRGGLTRGVTNFTLSPLGAGIDNLHLPDLLAVVVPVSHLRMRDTRNDQVLESHKCPVLPVCGISEEHMGRRLAQVATPPEQPTLEPVTVAQVAKWLKEPADHADKIEAIEAWARDHALQHLPSEWHLFLMEGSS